MTRSRSRPPGRLAFVLIAAPILLATVALWPVTTRSGVNYEVGEHPLPLWRKAWEFLDRHRQTAELASRVAGTAASDEERSLAVLRWTNEHIRPHPAEAPVIDDHVWSIVERGYGSSDQQADVFTTLLTYAGTPAYWILIGPDRPALPVSFALIDGRWRVFDVERGIAFRTTAHELATPEELAADPTLIRASAAGRVTDTGSYLAWFRGFTPPTAPEMLRARMQMPGPRLKFELSSLVGRGGRTWSIRPPGEQ
ncbi:MAG TPA: hypothetical protein VFZ56_05140 [Gemmatimonadaceae bacterium]